MANFRAIKSNQNSQQGQKQNKEFYQLKISKKISSTEPQNGIQLNANIQNMVPNNRRHHLTEAHSERSLSRKRKDESKNGQKVKKI